MRTFILLLALCAIASTLPLRQIMSDLQDEPHYSDPFKRKDSAGKDIEPGCTGDDIVSIYGDAYAACMPKPYDDKDPTKCYGDTPPGNTAVPAPIYNDGGTIRCGLVCSGRTIGNCAPEATCREAEGTGVGFCFYKNTYKYPPSTKIN